MSLAAFLRHRDNRDLRVLAVILSPLVLIIVFYEPLGMTSPKILQAVLFLPFAALYLGAQLVLRWLRVRAGKPMKRKAET